MEKLPTTDDVMNVYFLVDNEEAELIKSAMIEFAKMHVEAALKAASEKSEAFVRTNGEWTSSKVTASVNKESILNSYPLEKIK